MELSVFPCKGPRLGARVAMGLGGLPRLADSRMVETDGFASGFEPEGTSLDP